LVTGPAEDLVSIGSTEEPGGKLSKRSFSHARVDDGLYVVELGVSIAEDAFAQGTFVEPVRHSWRAAVQAHKNSIALL
jgi:hypothetical protein